MSVLETCDNVTAQHVELGSSSNPRTSGVSLYGSPESRRLLRFQLRWRTATDGLRQLLRLEFKQFVDGNRQPFTWSMPGTSRSYTVQIDAPPQFTRTGRKAGAASINLTETFLTD